MSASDSQPDFTAWRQKDTHRPVLRMSLAFPGSNPSTPIPAPTAENLARLRQQQQQQQSRPSASLSSTASDVSSLPIPSLDGLRLQRAQAKISTPPPPALSASEAASETTPSPLVGSGAAAPAITEIADVTASTVTPPDVPPDQPRDPQLEASLAASVSLTASEQLMRERLRLLEEEHDTLRRSLREKMKQAAAATTHLTEQTSASSLKTPATAQVARAASSTSSTSKTRASASSARDSRDLMSTSLTKSTSPSPSSHSTSVKKDAEYENNAKEHRDSKSSVAATRVEKAVDAACGSTERGSAVQAMQGSTASPLNLQSTQRNPITRFSPVEAEAHPFSPPAKDPTQKVRPDIAVVATEPAPLPQEAPPTRSSVQPLPPPQLNLADPSHLHYHYQLTMDQLRHDVESCAREIERLVEDQYDLRCSVRDTLVEMSRAGASPSGQNSGNGSGSHSGAHPPQPAGAAVTPSTSSTSFITPAVEEAAAQDQGNTADSSEAHPATSASVVPPLWLLPWLQQLRSEQSDNFQHLREEMVVLICHAVAEVQHNTRNAEAANTKNTTIVKEEAERRRNKDDVESTRSRSSSSPSRRTAADVSPRPRDRVVELNPHALVAHDTRADDPPPSLLWQRYRRLMSPTPPNRSHVGSTRASASVDPSERSGLSLRGQDALWSALLQMQKVVDAQSAQIAQLTECVLRVPAALPLTAPPAAVGPTPAPAVTAQPHRHHAAQKHAHSRPPREPSVTSTNTTMTSDTIITTTTTASYTATSADASFETRSASSTPPRRHTGGQADEERRNDRRQSHRHHHDSSSRHRSTSRYAAQNLSPVKETTHRSRHHSRPAPPPPPTAKAARHVSPSPKKDRQRLQQPTTTRQLDAIQDEMSDLRHLLRETLQRDRQLAQQQQQQQEPDTPLSDRFQRYPQTSHYAKPYEGSSVSDSEVRSAKYAQRRYVTAQDPPPARVSSRHRDFAKSSLTANTAVTSRPSTYHNGNGVVRAMPAEDTRYARGVVPQSQQHQYQYQQQLLQQQQQHRRMSNPHPVLTQQSYPYTPSPSASPIHEDWRGEEEQEEQEDMYVETTAAAEDGLHFHQEGEEDAPATPPQLPRQRVRTTLTSGLVYPH